MITISLPQTEPTPEEVAKENLKQQWAAELWDCEQQVAYWKDRHSKAKEALAHLLSDGTDKLKSGTLHVNDQYKITSVVQHILKFKKSDPLYKQLPQILDSKTFNDLVMREQKIELKLNASVYNSLSDELKVQLSSCIFWDTQLTVKYEEKKDDR